MTTTNCDPKPAAIRRAARRFSKDLAAEDMLWLTARVEARLGAAETGPLFVLDHALASAWTRERALPPRHEVIWGGGEVGNLNLRAFDAEGRLLVSRSYDLSPRRRGAGDV